MTARQIIPDVFAVGVIDWERRLFDELIPLPDGTSYNAYMIKGSEKTVLLDTVDPPKAEVLFNNLKELGIKRIDYIIAHHAEQDHSGSLPAVLAQFPMAKVVTNGKCKEMLKELLLLPDEAFIEIKDRETLSLGNKTLEFILAPWVHWPETMFTYLREDKLLFPCDFTGSHLATSELYSHDEARVYESAKRYYAEIMMPFRTSIKGHLEKLKGLEIKIIAPSHGPIHDRPEFILNAYRDWISDQVKNEVVVPYVSMHGSVKAMVDYFAEKLMEKGVGVKLYDLARTDIGKLAEDLVDAATIVIGAPTVLAGVHPLAAHAAFLANALRPKTRFISVIGSYSWGGKMIEQLTGLITGLRVEVLPPVVAKGYPKEADFRALDQLAETIANKHKEVIG